MGILELITRLIGFVVLLSVVLGYLWFYLFVNRKINKKLKNPFLKFLLFTGWGLFIFIFFPVGCTKLLVVRQSPPVPSVSSTPTPTPVASSSPTTTPLEEIKELDQSCKSENLKFSLNIGIHLQDIRFILHTNLPDTTKIMFNLSKGGYLAQDKVEIKNGEAVTGNFSNQNNILEGVYTLEILSYFNKIWQPKNILQSLNNYTSSCIKREDSPVGISNVLRLKINLDINN